MVSPWSRGEGGGGQRAGRGVFARYVRHRLGGFARVLLTFRGEVSRGKKWTEAARTDVQRRVVEKRHETRPDERRTAAVSNGLENKRGSSWSQRLPSLLTCRTICSVTLRTRAKSPADNYTYLIVRQNAGRSVRHANLHVCRTNGGKTVKLRGRVCRVGA